MTQREPSVHEQRVPSLKEPSVRIQRVPPCIWVMILLFGLGLACFSILRHVYRQSTILDLGIQSQVIWNTAHGRFFASSLEVSNYLADHLSPILALLAPLYWIWPDARLLLAFQSLALALGAYPVYRLADAEIQDRRVASAFALLYLLYPAVGFLARFDFHAEALVVPLLLMALWTWKSRRFGLASLWLILALCCREETGLVVACLALVLALRGRGQERRLAWQWLAIGLVWSVLGMGLVMPHLRGQESDTFLACYQHLGPSYSTGLMHLVRDPFGALADSWRGLVYFKATWLPRLLLPLGLLPLLALPALLPLAPALLAGLLSRCLPHSTIYYQYTAPMIPFLFAAGIQGYRRAERFLSQRLDRGGRRFSSREALLLLLLLGTAGALAWDFPWTRPIDGSGLYPVGGLQLPANQESFREALALIPADAAVAADNRSGPQVANRRYFYFFPYWESDRADWVLLDLQSYPPDDPQVYQRLEELLTPGGPAAPEQRYGVRYWNQGILLLQRGFPSSPVLRDEVLQELARLPGR